MVAPFKGPYVIGTCLQEGLTYVCWNPSVTGHGLWLPVLPYGLLLMPDVAHHDEMKLGKSLLELVLYCLDFQPLKLCVNYTFFFFIKFPDSGSSL